MGTTARAPLSLPAAIEFVRNLWLLMLTSIPLLVGAVELLKPPERHHSRTLLIAITVVAILCTVSWVSIRLRFIRRAGLQLLQNPVHDPALKRLRVGYIISFMLSEAVALYGINLRFRGFTLTEVAPFYIAGLLLMIFSAPRALGGKTLER